MSVLPVSHHNSNIDYLWHDEGLTALHQAVLDGSFTAVRLLLKHEAQVNQLDDDGWTPLHAACAEGHSNIARYSDRCVNAINVL